MDKKFIAAVDLILLAGSLIVLISFIGFQRPMVIAPTDKLVTTNTSILFSFDKSNLVYIDDNANFTSPEKIYVKDNLTINLKPGHYYWKIEGLGQSEVRELTIKSLVDLRLVESGDKYEVVNSGNSRLNVDIYNKGSLVGNVILDVDKGTDMTGDKAIGGLNEK